MTDNEDDSGPPAAKGAASPQVEPAFEPHARLGMPVVRFARGWGYRVAAVTLIAALTVATVVLAVQHRSANRLGSDRTAFLVAARQVALNLTTVSADSADVDIARILDSATGVFRDDFAMRSAAFSSVVKQARVSTVGTVTEAGVESIDGDHAKVLIAATSKVTNTAGAQDEPRIWRLRLAMQRTEGRILVSNVDFVP